MRIVIACSKSWFELSDEIKKNNEIFFINDKNTFTKSNIDKISPDFIFIPHWSWNISSEIYKNNKCIIFHTAPLPYGRGGSPIQNLILRGYKSSPVCALKVTKEIDAGDIYDKIDIDLSGSLTKIFERINFAVNSLILQLLNEDPTPKPQNGTIVKFKRLNLSDNEIDKNLDITEIYDRIRMLDHHEYPNSYITFGNLKVELKDAKFVSGKLFCKAIFSNNNIEN